MINAPIELDIYVTNEDIRQKIHSIANGFLVEYFQMIQIKV